MKSNRILHIRSSYSYGGPERQITYLTQSLNEMGIDSTVVTFVQRKNSARNNYYSKMQALGIHGYCIEIKSSFDPTPIKKIEKIILDGNYKILVGHDYRADYFVLRLAKKLDIPAISFSRGWTQNSLKVKFYEWLDVFFLRKMDGVVAVSRNKWQELSRKGIEPRRLVYIPNSILIDGVSSRGNFIRDQFDIPHDAFLIGASGRLSIEKDQKVLIKAAVKILEQEGDFAPYFILVGEGDMRKKLLSLIPRKYSNKIILAGWIEDPDQFYADVDMFVLTSLTEGFPNVLLEAGKYNLPVISTPVGGAAEMIEHERSGMFFPFGDFHSLADVIVSLRDNHEQRKKLGGELGKITRDKFCAKLNAQRFLNFVQGIRESL
jgi:glycosyltransferase involved in cell wall biosynthesis